MELDTKQQEKVIDLRKRGLSFRQIALLMGRNVKTIHRRFKRGVGRVKKLSTA